MKFKRVMILTVILMLLVSSFGPGIVFAEGENEMGDETVAEEVSKDSDEEINRILFGMVRTNTYYAYAQNHSDKESPMTQIVIDVSDYNASEDADVEVIDNLDGKENVLSWNNNDGQVTWQFNVNESGLYKVSKEYYAYKSINREIEFEMYLDGELPCE